VGLDGAPADRAVVASVAKAQALVVAAGRSDHGEHLVVDDRSAHGVGDGGRADGVDAAAHSCREDALELGERAHRGLLDTGDADARGRAQADGDGHRLLVVEQQRRHRGPADEAVAAADAGR